MWVRVSKERRFGGVESQEAVFREKYGQGSTGQMLTFRAGEAVSVKAEGGTEAQVLMGEKGGAMGNKLATLPRLASVELHFIFCC